MRRALVCCALIFAVIGCRNKVDAQGNKVEVGRVRLHTFPAGAKVWIDGELKIEATPATLVLKEGKYQLRIQAEGGEAVERVLEIEAGDVEHLSINIPKPPDARVSVISDVAGADVRINGYRRGATPLDGVITKPGPIDVTVTTPDGRAKGVKTELSIGEQKVIEVFFDEIVSKPEVDAGLLLESRPSSTGWATIGMKPDGKVYDVEDKLLGETPLVKRAFEPGEHTLYLRTGDGRYEKKVTILVEAEQHAVLRFQLRDEDQVPGWKPPPDAGLERDR
jgi:hypothetical protein